MWAIAANNKKYNDALGAYNSLKDPHLNSYFRRPQIKRQLIKANIINKENKIVEEISKTKNKQRQEREHKRELYQLLDDLIKRNRQLDLSLDDGDNRQIGKFGNLRWNANGQLNKDRWNGAEWNGNSAVASVADINTKEDLLRHAKLMFKGDGHSKVSTLDNLERDSNNEREMLLQRLDRMIRTVKEYNYGPDTTGNSRCRYDRNKPPNEANLRSSKSYQDIRNGKNQQQQQLERRQLQQQQQIIKKSYSSTSQLDKVLRPKSSYGRHRQSPHLNSSQPNLANNSCGKESPNQSPNANSLKKSKSLADFGGNSGIEDDEDGGDYDDVISIDSLDGESLNDSNDETTEINSSNQSSYANRQSRTGFNNPNITINESTNNKKYYAFDRRFVRNSSRQKVKMTLKYNGMIGTTNRNSVRANVKVFQQVTIGGNSILIYDGNVKSGDLFSFDVRPHPNNSFAIIVILNSIRDLRLNTCCEHKHRRGTRLSHFTIVDVVGSRPCIACQTQQQEQTDFTDKMPFKRFRHHHSDLMFLNDSGEMLIGTDYKRQQTTNGEQFEDDQLFNEEDRDNYAQVHNNELDPNYNANGDEEPDTFGVQQALRTSRHPIEIINNDAREEWTSAVVDDNEWHANKQQSCDYGETVNAIETENNKNSVEFKRIEKNSRLDNPSDNGSDVTMNGDLNVTESVTGLTEEENNNNKGFVVDDSLTDDEDREFLEIEKQIEAEEETKNIDTDNNNNKLATLNNDEIAEIEEIDDEENTTELNEIQLEPTQEEEEGESNDKQDDKEEEKAKVNDDSNEEIIEEVDEINCDYIFDETLPTVIDVDSDSD